MYIYMQKYTYICKHIYIHLNMPPHRTDSASVPVAFWFDPTLNPQPLIWL